MPSPEAYFGNKIKLLHFALALVALIMISFYDALVAQVPLALVVQLNVISWQKYHTTLYVAAKQRGKHCRRKNGPSWVCAMSRILGEKGIIEICTLVIILHLI